MMKNGNDTQRFPASPSFTSLQLKFFLLRTVHIFFLALVLCWHTVPASASPADVLKIIDDFKEAQTKGNLSAMEEATTKLMQNFDHWENWARSTKADPKLAKAIDEKMVDMTKQIWSEIAVKSGGVDRVVPVGSLGSRNKATSKYIIGKSDKDLIPMGPRAKESVQEFNQAFKRKFGIKPEAAKINILDPTNPSNWKSRLEAIENIEKYNTVGGNKWLKNEMYRANNDVWSLNPNGGISEIPYRSAVSAPEPLSKADAVGFFSDNTKFRAHYNDAAPHKRLLMQSKYDLRNIQAYELAGGKLTFQERALMEAAEMARKGDIDGAIAKYGSAVSKKGDKAAQAYLSAMDDFTTKMGKKVFSEHISLLKSKPSILMTQEMAGAINNLPIDMAGKIGKEVGEASAKSRVIWRQASNFADDILKSPGIQSKIIDLFNTRAHNAYGKAYDALSDTERLALHGAIEESSSWGKTLGKGAVGIAAIWALYDSMHSGYQEGGTRLAAGYGVSRLAIELIQYQYPPLALVEIGARIAAFGIEYKINKYKTSVLDKLYTLYKANPSTTNLDDIIKYDSVTGYLAGGLREFSKDLRAQAAKKGKTLSNADIDKALRKYLVERHKKQQMANAIETFKATAKAWINKYQISLIPGGSVYQTQKLEEKDPEAYRKLILHLLVKHHKLMETLKKDGIMDVKANAWYLLSILYRNGPEAYEKQLAKVYARYGKVYPPATGKNCSQKCTTTIKKVRGATRELSTLTENKKRGMIKPGIISAISGSYKNNGVNNPCDPAISKGPFSLALGGEILAEIKWSQPVPNKWSLGNHNTALIVNYSPQLPNGDYGIAQRLIALGGGPDDKEAKQKAVVPGPGRITLTTIPANGRGPLSGSCFDQSFQGKVSLLSVKKDMPAIQGMTLNKGDTLKTGKNGRILIKNSCRGVILVLANSEVLLDEKGQSIKVLKGRVKMRSYKGCKAPAVEAGGVIVQPQGTEYEVEVVKGKAIKVRVQEGSVQVQSPKNSRKIFAGYELDLSSNEEKPLSPQKQDKQDYDGLSLEELMEVDDDIPEPYGCSLLTFHSRRFHNGWIWQDPDHDAQVISIDGGVKIDVPNGNDFWKEHNGSPRLMHRVTGDFDLEMNLFMFCEGNHLASTEFFIYSTGSHLGYMNKQAQREHSGVDHLLMGGGWLRKSDKNSLLYWNHQPYYSPDAPEKATLFRLSRRGNWFYSQWSTNGGKTWQLSGRQKLHVPETLYTGLMFKRVVADGKYKALAENTITNMKLTSAPSGSMQLPSWLSQEIYGRIEPTATGGKFIHPKDHVAKNRMILSKSITDDFNAVALVDLGQNKIEQSGIIAGLKVFGLDEKNWAGIFLTKHYKHNNRFVAEISSNGKKASKWPYNAPNKTWLRLSRQDGKIRSYFWQEGVWVLAKEFNIPLPEEVHLCLISGTNREVRQPMAAEVTMNLEHLAFGAEAKKPYTPKDYTLMPKLPSPKLNLPKGVVADLYQTPFPMINPFFDNSGNIYLFPAAKKKQVLIKLRPGGPAMRFRESKAFAGKNWKRGLWLDDRLLVIVNGSIIRGGENLLHGLYEVNAEGTATEIGGKSARSNGLADFALEPDGSFVFSDSFYNTLWRQAPDKSNTPLMQGGRLTCVHNIARHPDTGNFFLHNNSTGNSCGIHKSGVYLHNATGEISPYYMAPENKNLGGITWLEKGIYPQGLYISQPQTGELLRIIGKEHTEVVLSGLENPQSITASPDGMALAIMLGQDKLLVIHSAKTLAQKKKVVSKPTKMQISGIWKGPNGEVYLIKQRGQSFSWIQIEPASGQVARGTLHGDDLTVAWRGSESSGSAKGRISQRNNAAKAIQITWDNGKVFKRSK